MIKLFPDKFLMEIISYVLERGHYDPKTLDDKFSENVFFDFLKSIDGQRRFFLNADIRSLERFKFEIDDQFKKTSLDFYATIRSLYRQKRADEIRNGESGDAVPIPEITLELDEPMLNEPIAQTSKK